MTTEGMEDELVSWINATKEKRSEKVGNDNKTSIVIV